GQLLADRTFAKDLHRQLGVLHQPGLVQDIAVHGRAIVETLQVLEVDDVEPPLEVEVAEAALRHPAEDRGLAVLVAALDVLADAGLGALGAPPRRLTLAGAASAALAGPLAVARGAGRDVVDHAHWNAQLRMSRHA